MNWHLLSLAEVSQQLNTSPSGISNATAVSRLLEVGKNQIEEKKKKSVLLMLLRQLTDFMILILIAAAVVSGIIGDVIDSVIILAIIIINAIVGFIQEYRAEKALEALKKMTVNNARVIRDGKLMDIPASDLVYGDVVGVVKNFHFSSLHRQVEPLVFLLNPMISRYILVKFKDGKEIGKQVGFGGKDAYVTMIEEVIK